MNPNNVCTSVKPSDDLRLRMRKSAWNYTQAVPHVEFLEKAVKQHGRLVPAAEDMVLNWLVFM